MAKAAWPSQEQIQRSRNGKSFKDPVRKFCARCAAGARLGPEEFLSKAGLSKRSVDPALASSKLPPVSLPAIVV